MFLKSSCHVSSCSYAKRHMIDFFKHKIKQKKEKIKSTDEEDMEIKTVFVRMIIFPLHTSKP